MSSNIVLASEGKCVFIVEVFDGAGVVVRNAVRMLVDELHDVHCIAVEESAAVGGTIRIAQPDSDIGPEQTLSVSTEQSPCGWQITIGGADERGILYGVGELLDRMSASGGELLVEPVNIISTPSIRRRGTGRHWGPDLSTPEGAEDNVRLIRALARKRVNQLLWIDGWISPGWYRFLDFRHYPQLRRPDALESVTLAKDCLSRVIEEARSWGMDFYLSTTEFNVPARLLEVSPEIFHTNAQGFPVLRFEHPGTWKFYGAKVREMIEDFPGLSGIELWSAEAMDPSICHFDHPDEWPLTRQFLHLYEQTLQAMDEAGRPDARIVCSMFIHHPEGERAYEPLCGKLPARCDGRMKMQVEDYYRFNSPTTLAGRVSPGREWVEFDPGGEHRGDWIGWINVHMNFIHERMLHYYGRGVESFICRIRGFSPGPYSELVGDFDVLSGIQAIKYDAYLNWCWDINLSIEDVWHSCRKPGYPDEMLEFYLLSEKVSDQTQYVGQCLTNNNHASFLGSVEHYQMKIAGIDVYGNDWPRERRWILEPTEANLELIIREKEEALGFVARMQQILKSCEGKLPDGDYEQLQSTMDYQEQCVRVFRYHTEAYFRYRLFDLGLPGGNYGAMMDAVTNCEREIKKLRAYDEVQADNAYALMGSIKSLAWVKCCSVQMTPKGIIEGA